MNRQVNILLVEDNEGDIVLTIHAFKNAGVDNEITIGKTRDGYEALQYLRKDGIYNNATTPDLVLLDINLPKIDGMEVLTEIKNDERFKMIPVVMLTTSESEKDMAEAYRHHASLYIIKPLDKEKIISILDVIKNSWSSI
jgi:chemotaxis family two-component system response regulator Rcp1